MAGSILGRVAKAMTGACLTLLLLGLGASGGVEAGCVHDRPSVTHFEHLARAGALPGAVEHEAKSLPAKPPACDGPSCVKPPVVPPASSWTAPSVQDSWAMLAGALVPSPRPASHWPVEASMTMPETTRASIFHPPQVASV